jgi:hypothetical protein
MPRGKPQEKKPDKKPILYEHKSKSRCNNPPAGLVTPENDPEQQEYEISFQNIIRIDHVYKPELMLDLEKVK